MRRHRRSLWALALSILSLVMASFSLAMTGLALSELKRIRAGLNVRRVSPEELDRLWASLQKTEPREVAAKPAKLLRWNGVCARYGASTVEAFRRSVESDPTLAARFASFRWADARTVVLGEPRVAMVTFRKDGRIVWTRRPVSLVKGETLVTDGETTVRGFCCNEVSEAAPAPSELLDPAAAPEEFSDGTGAPPELFAGAAAPTELAQSSGSPPDITDNPIPPPEERSVPSPPPTRMPRLPFAPPYGAPTPHSSGGSSPVPEPTTLALVGTGLGALILLRIGRSRRP